jgi:hypothetical protein
MSEHPEPTRLLEFTIRARRILALLRAWMRYQRNRLRRQNRVAFHAILGLPKVINLPSRPDRLSSVKDQMVKIGYESFELFAGVAHENGALGCALAHRNVLDADSQDPAEIVWVVEDDLVVSGSTHDLTATIQEFVDNPGLDVLCLAELTGGPVLPISRNLALTVSTITTACYLVKPWSRSELRQSFHESVVMLSLGISDMKGGIDIHWKKLQFSHLVFCIPRKRLTQQSASFSDIRKRNVDYYGKKDSSRYRRTQASKASRGGA